MASSLPGALLCTLVKHRFWTPKQALANARQCADEIERAQITATLVGVLPPEQREDIAKGVLEAVDQLSIEVTDPSTHNAESRNPKDLPVEQSRVLAILSPFLSGPLLRKALLLAEKYGGRIPATVPLAARLEAQEAAPMFEAALAKLDPETSYETFQLLANHLPDGLIERSLLAAQQVSHPYQRTKALAAFADRMDPERREILLADIRSATAALPPDQQPDVMADVAAYLSQDELWQIAKSTEQIDFEVSRVEILARLVPLLTGEHQVEALRTVRADADALEMEAHQYKTEALAQLLPLLDEPDRSRAIRQALRAAIPALVHFRGPALSLLVPNLPVELFAETIAAARHFGNEYYTSLLLRALLRIGELAPASLSAKDLTRFVNLTAAMKSDENRGYVLRPLATALARLPASQRERLWRRVKSQKIRWQLKSSSARGGPPKDRDGDKQHWIDSLVTWLREALLPKSFHTAAANRWVEAAKAHAPFKLAPQLVRPFVDQALARVLAQDDPALRCRVLALLVSRTDPAAREPLHELLLAQDDTELAHWMDEISPSIAPAYVGRYLERISRMAAAKSRIRAFAAILTIVSGSEVGSVLDSILDGFEESGESAELHWVFAKIASRLSPEQLQRAMAIVRRMSYPIWKCDAMSDLLSHVPPGQRDGAASEALSWAIEIDDASDRRERLDKIIARFHHLPRSELYTLWRRTLHSLALRKRENLLADISAIAPLAEVLGGTAALIEIARALEDTTEWWP
jgi:hypothetical protein